MSCTPVTPEMRRLLQQGASWPAVDVDELLSTPEWKQARAWGWIMPSGELTGTGFRHVRELPRGLVSE